MRGEDRECLVEEDGACIERNHICSTRFILLVMKDLITTKIREMIAKKVCAFHYSGSSRTCSWKHYVTVLHYSFN